MTVTTAAIPDVLVIEPKVFGDERGLFFESFNQEKFETAVGHKVSFVQDNHSHSVKNVLRGLHYQIKQPLDKLVRLVQGEVFGKWVGELLSAENRKQLWLPEGFARGFLVLSDTVVFIYKTTDYYAPEYECRIAWNDVDINIQWPKQGEPVLSVKDQEARLLTVTEQFI